MNPLVSVIIPTYRRSFELERAIISVQTQTYEKCEIIVVDDNDDKEWNQIVQSIINKCSKNNKVSIRLIQNHPNLGSAKARNKGIEKSQGDFVVFLDDDDIYLPERVKKQLDVMIEHNADFGITDIVLYNEDESINETRKRAYLLRKEGQNLLVCHLKYNMTGTDTLMFKKTFLNQLGGFDPIDLGDEYYLMMKAILGGGKICYTPCCDIKAYVHTGESGLSSGKGKINGENKLFHYKKQFFYMLKLSDRRFVTMRHYAVLAFAYKRMGNNFKFLSNGTRCFFTSPIGCIKLLRSRYS